MQPHNDSLGFLLADVARLLRQAFRASLEGSSLTFAQARALMYVARREGVRQVELADMLEIQPITLARLIDQLEAAGLVRRQPDPADRRAYQLFLTPDAEPQLAAIEKVLVGIRQRAMAGLQDDEAAAAIAALKKMQSNLSTR